MYFSLSEKVKKGTELFFDSERSENSGQTSETIRDTPHISKVQPVIPVDAETAPRN